MEGYSALLALCARSEFPSHKASNVDFEVSLIRICISQTVEWPVICDNMTPCDVILMLEANCLCVIAIAWEFIHKNVIIISK